MAKLLKGNLSGARLAAVGLGSALTALGVVGVKAYIDAAKAGDKLLKIHQQLLVSGVSKADADRGELASERISALTPGTTPADVYAIFAELRTVLGSTTDALSALSGAANVSAGLLTSGVPGVTANSLIDLFKSLDLMGAALNQKSGKFDPATFVENLDALARIDVLTHGQLTPSTLLQIAKRGGFTAQAAEFRQFLAAELASWLELGSSAGPGLSQAAMEFVGGRVTKRTRDAMVRYHLASPAGFTDDHGVYTMLPGALKGGQDILTHSLTFWVNSDLLPTLRKDGIKTAQAILAAVTQITGSVRLARLLLSKATPAGQIMTARDQEQANKAIYSGAPWTALTQGTLTGSINSLHDALEGLWQILGTQATSPVIASVNDITTAIRNAEAWASTHPGAAREIANGFGALSVGLVALGGATTIAALTKLGGKAGLLVGLAAAIATLSSASADAQRTLTDAAVGGAAGARLGMKAGGIRGGVAGAILGAAALAYLDNAKSVNQWAGHIADAFWHDLTRAAAGDAAAVAWAATATVHLVEGAGSWAAQVLRGLEHGAESIGDAIGNAIERALPWPFGGKSTHKTALIPPGGMHATVITTVNTHLDGRVVAKSVSSHQAQFLSQPAAGTSAFDPSMLWTSPGMSYSP